MSKCARLIGINPKKDEFRSMTLTAGQKFNMGRSPDAQCTILDVNVSRNHASLEFDKSSSSWNIIDNKSSNGVFVNSKKIPPCSNFKLEDGDVITLGPILDYRWRISMLDNVEPEFKRPKLNDVSNKEKTSSLSNTSSDLEESQLLINKKALSDLQTQLKNLEEESTNKEKEKERAKEERLQLQKEMAEQQRQLLERIKEQEEKNAEYEAKLLELQKECHETKTAKQEKLEEYEKKLEDHRNNDGQKAFEIFENELNCSICNEIFITPMTTSCGHVFCRVCLDQWVKNCGSVAKTTCPDCRAKIKTKSRNHYIENLIEKLFSKLTDSAKEERRKLVEARARGLTMIASVPSSSPNPPRSSNANVTTAATRILNVSPGQPHAPVIVRPVTNIGQRPVVVTPRPMTLSGARAFSRNAPVVANAPRPMAPNAVRMVVQTPSPTATNPRRIATPMTTTSPRAMAMGASVIRLQQLPMTVSPSDQVIIDGKLYQLKPGTNILVPIRTGVNVSMSLPNAVLKANMQNHQAMKPSSAVVIPARPSNPVVVPGGPSNPVLIPEGPSNPAAIPAGQSNSQPGTSSGAGAAAEVRPIVIDSSSDEEDADSRPDTNRPGGYCHKCKSFGHWTKVCEKSQKH